MPDGVPRVARVFGTLVGGFANHADELEGHVSETLQYIKTRAELPDPIGG